MLSNRIRTKVHRFFANTSGQIFNNGIFILILIVLFFNCRIEVQRTSLNFPNNKNFTKISNSRIVLRNIEFPASTIMEIMQMTFKTNLKLELEKTGQFQSVGYFNEYLDKDAFVLDIKFNQYYEDYSIHPWYIPGIFLTLGLYPFFGGPISKNQVSDEFIISVFKPNGQLKTELKKRIKYEENDTLYTIFINAKNKRAELFLKSIQDAFSE